MKLRFPANKILPFSVAVSHIDINDKRVVAQA